MNELQLSSNLSLRSVILHWHIILTFPKIFKLGCYCYICHQEAYPVCRSNKELDEVVGQNTCGIEPDIVELECSVKYRGNIPPQMEWSKIGQNISTPFPVSVVTSNNRFVSTLKLIGDIALSNSSYVCGTKRTSVATYNCTSEVIKIFCK